MYSHQCDERWQRVLPWYAKGARSLLMVDFVGCLISILWMATGLIFSIRASIDDFCFFLLKSAFRIIMSGFVICIETINGWAAQNRPAFGYSLPLTRNDCFLMPYTFHSRIFYWFYRFQASLGRFFVKGQLVKVFQFCSLYWNSDRSKHPKKSAASGKSHVAKVKVICPNFVMFFLSKLFFTPFRRKTLYRCHASC